MKNLFATAASVLVLGFTVPAMAQTNTSTVNQQGLGQIADVDQIGTAANNSSTILQGLNGGGSAGNKVHVDQTGTVSIENISAVVQDGIDNDAKINQNGNGFINDYNYSYAEQTGNDNKIEVIQGNVVTNNTSVIDQYGDNNKATVSQGGGNEGVNLTNYSNIDQDGNNNTATVDQGGAGVVSNTSYIAQSGGNTANVNQH